MTFEVGQVVEYMGDGIPGVVVSVGPQPPGSGETYVVVLWGADEDGWLTGGWFDRAAPLTLSDKPLPEDIARLIADADRPAVH